MDPTVSEPTTIRFGPFELALDTGELRRDGAPVRLQPQPARVLALLVARPGELVTRDEIQRGVWNGDTFVDFDHGINFCIKEIRTALGDSARDPRYVETLPRRGYRFVAQLETACRDERATAPVLAHPPPVEARPEVPESSSKEPSSARTPVVRRAAVVLLAGALVVAGVVWLRARPSADAPDGAPSPEAREAYLTGRYLWNKGTTDDLVRSLEHFTRAVEIDPGYARAHAGLADSYRQLAMSGAMPTNEASEKALASARRALELDPLLAEARVSLASLCFRYSWDWPGAEREFRQALADDPDYALGYHDYAWFLVAMGRFDEAVRAMEHARDLDPLSPRANADVGWVYLRARRYDDAIVQIERTFAIEPDYAPAYGCLELAYVYKGLYAEARDVAVRHLARSGAAPEVLSDVAAAEPADGLRRAWRWRLDRRIEAARDRPMKPYPFATLYASLGEPDRAFEWLERAFAERDPMLVTVNVDPACDALRSDARFADLLRRIGLGA